MTANVRSFAVHTLIENVTEICLHIDLWEILHALHVCCCSFHGQQLERFIFLIWCLVGLVVRRRPSSLYNENSQQLADQIDSTATITSFSMQSLLIYFNIFCIRFCTYVQLLTVSRIFFGTFCVVVWFGWMVGWLDSQLSSYQLSFVNLHSTSEN